jgi:hypothetical protein
MRYLLPETVQHGELSLHEPRGVWAHTATIHPTTHVHPTSPGQFVVDRVDVIQRDRVHLVLKLEPMSVLLSNLLEDRPLNAADLEVTLIPIFSPEGIILDSAKLDHNLGRLPEADNNASTNNASRPRTTAYR